MAKARLLSIFALAAALSGCIRNDIPYPVIPASITAMDVEGALSVGIDEQNSRVSITLDEMTDIRNVNIKSVSFNEESVKPSWDITGVHDLSKKLKLTLTTYQDYVWEIRTEQPVERYLNVAGQIGSARIDAVNHRAIVDVPESADVTALDIVSIKLGPRKISSYSPDPSSIHDLSEGAEITLSYHDVKEVWHLYAEVLEEKVRMTGVDAWTRHAWISGQGEEGKSCGIRIRPEDSDSWTEIPAESTQGGSFTVCAEGLQPRSSYIVKAYCGQDESNESTFVTDTDRQLPNSGFETWSNAESSKYCSFYDPASSDPDLQQKWWCSGNKGSTTVGSSYTITMPDLNDKVAGNSSIKLASAYVIIKFAAGNVFSGEFSRTIGTSGGVIRLGRPFEQRPLALRLSLKYNSGIITQKTLSDKPDGDPVKVGDNDRGVVWIALGDWDYRRYGGTEQCPLEVNTTDKSTFFDRNSENVIAYGELILDKSTDGWIRVDIPLEYHTLTRKPTHIVVSAAASLLGDYFTGSADSVMWLDALELVY